MLDSWLADGLSLLFSRPDDVDCTVNETLAVLGLICCAFI